MTRTERLLPIVPLATKVKPTLWDNPTGRAIHVGLMGSPGNWLAQTSAL